MQEHTEQTTLNDLIIVEKTRTQFQRMRIQMSNRIAAIEDDRSDLSLEVCTMFFSRFEKMEKDCAALIADMVEDHPLWPWMEAVKGVGPGLAGSLLAPINIGRARTVAALWRYSGLGVGPDGQRDRLVKGEKAKFNADLKRTCYLVATSFLRVGSPYREEYDKSKAYYETSRPDWTKAHIDLAARRKMIKLFMSHLWTVWRDVAGYPIALPYAFAIMNHSDFKPVWKYVPNYEYSYVVRHCVPEGYREPQTA